MTAQRYPATLVWLPPGFFARLVVVSADHAQLSSLAAALDDLTARVTAVADRYHDTPAEGLSIELYEVERNLRAASRRLSQLVHATRPQ
jgi:hypothetical protein